MSGMYWGLSALCLTGHEQFLDGEAALAWLLSCQKESGGFGAAPEHDASLLATLSAVQVAALLGGRTCWTGRASRTVRS